MEACSSSPVEDYPCEGPINTWRHSHTWRSHFTRGSHSPVEVGCAGPVHKLKTHLQVEVLFSRGGPIHRWGPFHTCRGPIHMQRPHSHVENLFTYGAPVHKWRSCKKTLSQVYTKYHKVPQGRDKVLRGRHKVGTRYHKINYYFKLIECSYVLELKNSYKIIWFYQKKLIKRNDFGFKIMTVNNYDSKYSILLQISVKVKFSICEAAVITIEC